MPHLRTFPWCEGGFCDEPWWQGTKKGAPGGVGAPFRGYGLYGQAGYRAAMEARPDPSVQYLKVMSAR